MIEVLQLLPGGGAQALGQSVQVSRTQLHGLVADVDHVLSIGLSLGANVAEAGKGADRDYVWVRHTGDVAGDTSITASLCEVRGGIEGGREWREGGGEREGEGGREGRREGEREREGGREGGKEGVH